MSTLLTREEGIFLVSYARQIIEAYICEQSILDIPEVQSSTLLEPRGVFVTIKKIDTNDTQHSSLRGCIGRLQPPPDDPNPAIPLLLATRQAALSAALEDPRFPPVREDELDQILIEVSILTPPEEIHVQKKDQLPQHIRVGVDGLIIDSGGWHRGLLLPQVAPEQGWNTREFLRGCCQKAGLSPDCYLDPKVKVLKFQAQIFAETSVKGDIVERAF